MLQEQEPSDFVIGAGRNYSVCDLVETAFGYLDLDPGEHVTTNPALERPAEVERLVATIRRPSASSAGGPARASRS
jgi:GDPmannose 4,6-dehydratase